MTCLLCKNENVNCLFFFFFRRIAGEDEVARELREKVRVLCWVMTGPKNHEKKAKHVKRTWGKRCNVLIFMSSKEGNPLGIKSLSISKSKSFRESRACLLKITRESLKFLGISVPN